MNLKRVRQLNNQPQKKGPLIYWMQREHRVSDNWALLYAQKLAKENNQDLAVIFCLRTHAVDFTERLITFMLEGLKEVEEKLKEYNIPFYFLIGDPPDEIPAFLAKHSVGALITEFHSLTMERGWRESIADNIDIPLYEVDARNIIPCWIASPKQEFGAYTLRPKYHRQLPEYLDVFPHVAQQVNNTLKQDPIDWESIDKKISKDTSVKKVAWLQPGEQAARQQLRDFIFDKLPKYHEDRNDPTNDGQSGLSPYLHFGHIASQRIVLEIQKHKTPIAAEEAFIEEVTVRRELADNFCFYNKNYATTEGFPNWAKETLATHLLDKREYIYSLKELETCKTHDDLWNAAMLQAIKTGIMHGWVRMYWAKKILEWSKTPDDAMKHATFLMDKWFLDGREANGFTGIAWSMGGVHDRAWFDRPIFGKVRYMNYAGAKRKFDVQAYIEKVNQL